MMIMAVNEETRQVNTLEVRVRDLVTKPQIRGTLRIFLNPRRSLY